MVQLGLGIHLLPNLSIHYLLLVGLSQGECHKSIGECNTILSAYTWYRIVLHSPIEILTRYRYLSNAVAKGGLMHLCNA